MSISSQTESNSSTHGLSLRDSIAHKSFVTTSLRHQRDSDGLQKQTSQIARRDHSQSTPSNLGDGRGVSAAAHGPVAAILQVGQKHCTEQELKRLTGAFYTVGNPFVHPAFTDWARKAELSRRKILEPFAGSNRLIKHLRNMGLCNRFSSFDILPGSRDVQQRDTLESFPIGYGVCVTNPPWLARNSATKRGLPFPSTLYDNLYKHCLDKCLEHCNWVAAIIPESFLRADIFHERLQHCVSLPRRLFRDTGHPACLALFGPEQTADALIWAGSKRVGWLDELIQLRPKPRKQGCTIRFNERNGNVGLIALDNTIGPSIRFCEVEELADYRVKHSGRHITKLHVETKLELDRWNHEIEKFRSKTKDVLMTCYKGIRKDGMYRRRLDWQLARGIIHDCQLNSS